MSDRDASAPEGADGAERTKAGQLPACGAAVRVTYQVAGVAFDPQSGHALLARAVQHELVNSSRVPTHCST